MISQLTRSFKIEVATAVLAWSLASACRNLPASNNLWGLCSRNDAGADLQKRLSPTAQVYLPGTSGYNEATTRWSVLDAPTANLVVVPAIEKDVAEIVKYANAQNISYLAVNGGHGAITTIGRFQDGIEIWMNQLSSVEIANDGQTAKIGGGTLSKTVTDTLWSQSKQTVTGGCECTSLLGPAWVAVMVSSKDAMDSSPINSELQTIDKESELWWVMQGAGHNFGIVTSVTSKIYDLQYPDWAYASFIFTGDKIEGLYGAISKYLLLDGNQPVYIINYSFFFNDPSIDPDRPVVMFFILQEGVTVVDPVYTDPFHELEPLVTNAAGGTYQDLPAWTGNANDALPCQKSGRVNIRFPIDLMEYNIEAQRKVYDLFASVTQQNTALNGSLFLFEGYSTQGVKSVSSEQTAFPFRSDNLLVSPYISYPPDTPELDRAAADFGNSLRRILYEKSGRKELHTYVNYAFGDETEMNWYGSEQWRQDRLKALKQKYDPLGKFSFYAPIS